MLAHATNGKTVDLNKGALPFRFAPPAHRESCLDVPKIVHFIWIGSPLPAKYAATIERIKEHNPGYEVMLWKAPLPRMRNRDLYDAETNWGAKADILRYEIVHRWGGIYLDVDHESLGPGSLHPDMQRAFVQASGAPWCNTTNSDFGFAAGSEFLGYVMTHLRDPRVRSQPEVPSRTGPTFFTTAFLSFADARLVHPDGAALLSRLHHTGDHNWR